jgi:hypothetical protein
MDFMVGPIDINKKVSVRGARSTLQVGEQSAPTDIKDQQGANEEAEQSRIIMQIYEILRAQQEANPGPVHFFEFILNPQSFSESVENLFFTSFLVRDGKVSMDIDENDIPVIEVVDPGAGGGAARKAKREKRQLILDLDVNLWNELLDLYELEEPIIPSRGNSDYGKFRWTVN